LPLSGCNTIPKDAFQLTETSLQDRQLQTRKFKTNDEIGLLAAGIGVLQDMGYTLEATEKSVGLITASKMTSAVDAAQVTLAILAAAMGGGSTPIDDKQKIRVTFVTHASQNEKGYFLARITFQRIVWRTNGTVSKATTIKDLELYEGFYEKLSKSVFLEAHKI
jgi:hypothetical protein